MREKIEVHKHEHKRIKFYTDRGTFDVSINHETLRISSDDAIAVLPVASNVVLVMDRTERRTS